MHPMCIVSAWHVCVCEGITGKSAFLVLLVKYDVARVVQSHYLSPFWLVMTKLFWYQRLAALHLLNCY